MDELKPFCVKGTAHGTYGGADGKGGNLVPNKIDAGALGSDFVFTYG